MCKVFANSRWLFESSLVHFSFHTHYTTLIIKQCWYLNVLFVSLNTLKSPRKLQWTSRYLKSSWRINKFFSITCVEIFWMVLRLDKHSRLAFSFNYYYRKLRKERNLLLALINKNLLCQTLTRTKSMYLNYVLQFCNPTQVNIALNVSCNLWNSFFLVKLLY